MNTTAKGDAFEERALRIIETMIEEKRIAVMADAYTIKKKEPYYSHARKGNIIFDLTVEVQPPGADRYSLIYIIECKDYKTPISIDRLEAFSKKIEQVAPRNSKAVFIATSRFQKSAHNFAESQGIMLVGVDISNQYNIVLYNKLRSNTVIDFYNKNKVKLDQGEKHLEKEIDTTLIKAFQNIKGIENNVKNYSKENIELIANEVLNHIDPGILNCERVASIDDLVEYTNKILGLRIKNTNNAAIFGCFDANNQNIQVNHSLYKAKRYKFVLAHEIGHCIIHDGTIVESELINTLPDSEYSFKTNKHSLKNEKQWIEWQANYFAACLTMPKVPLMATLLQYQRRFGVREGHLYVDDQPGNIKDFIKIINAMSIRLELSKTSIINRLKGLGKFTDNSRARSIGQIMHDYQSQLVI
ncbi:Restriction endonuclease [Hymenobacter daecheongensis DSM 21074]|uniref:Restriction endonuclease n=1 Tax=Hymenobacter daecheongensis DSM 21074 TaxID=1121955 RepID=A0A1M6JTT4_9BACT|nr:ImmA/IrrE family metallo-endopeptidase [Hymenobacter daecheongensis]SHJ50103.1 Restriction endonuclease [Hymenobacter daecheongensis DSM 21074]